MSGAREAERLKELKELYEGKTKEKDEEISRMRVLTSK